METHYAIYCAVKAVFLCSGLVNIHSPLFDLNFTTNRVKNA